MGSRQNILLSSIEQTRVEMIELAHQYGYSNPNVVRCSQKLDSLMNDYDDRKRKQ